MAKKIGSEKNIPNSLLKLKFGTTDKKSPSVVYFEGGTYIRPRNEEKSYKNELAAIRNSFDKFSKSFSSENNLSPFNILNFELADDRISTKRGTYLSFQFYFKQNITSDFNEISRNLITSMSGSVEKLLKVINDNGFSYSKTK